MKTRVPDNLTDDRAMRPFLDGVDRRFLKAGEITDLATSPTNEQLAEAFNLLLAALRTK